MAPPGRKPTPTKLKEFRNNPGKRKLPPAEPQPEELLDLTPPAFLKGEARAEWNRVAPQLHKLGLLTVVDRAALAVYCRTWERWLAVEVYLAKNGQLTIEGTGENGAYLQQRPEVSIARQLASQLRAYAAEFGFTPASRARVPGKPESDPKGKLAAFTQRRKAG